MSLPQRNKPPSYQFWWGTDDLGRDLFIRVWMGGRITLAISLVCAFVDMIVGVTYGVLAGYAPKNLQEGLMRFLDILTCIPYLLFVILFLRYYI